MPPSALAPKPREHHAAGSRVWGAARRCGRLACCEGRRAGVRACWRARVPWWCEGAAAVLPKVLPGEAGARASQQSPAKSRCVAVSFSRQSGGERRDRMRGCRQWAARPCFGCCSTAWRSSTAHHIGHQPAHPAALAESQQDQVSLGRAARYGRPRLIGAVPTCGERRTVSPPFAPPSSP